MITTDSQRQRTVATTAASVGRGITSGGSDSGSNGVSRVAKPRSALSSYQLSLVALLLLVLSSCFYLLFAPPLVKPSDGPAVDDGGDTERSVLTVNGNSDLANYDVENDAINQGPRVNGNIAEQHELQLRLYEQQQQQQQQQILQLRLQVQQQQDSFKTMDCEQFSHLLEGRCTVVDPSHTNVQAFAKEQLGIEDLNEHVTHQNSAPEEHQTDQERRHQIRMRDVKRDNSGGGDGGESQPKILFLLLITVEPTHRNPFIGFLNTTRASKLFTIGGNWRKPFKRQSMEELAFARDEAHSILRSFVEREFTHLFQHHPIAPWDNPLGRWDILDMVDIVSQYARPRIIVVPSDPVAYAFRHVDPKNIITPVDMMRRLESDLVWLQSQLSVLPSDIYRIVHYDDLVKCPQAMVPFLSDWWQLDRRMVQEDLHFIQARAILPGATMDAVGETPLKDRLQRHRKKRMKLERTEYIAHTSSGQGEEIDLLIRDTLSGPRQLQWSKLLPENTMPLCDVYT
eukprot:TRINITY_DN1796_c0_g1_i1.p1 TRINITY_DN1796_c0_g1~~TRINITY_DN1796_c0_g1_i1.p1  ORF type:complete len:512 (-),score=109.37 TRINITY_DN1796_c0_g1_i1:24-1559(-)